MRCVALLQRAVPAMPTKMTSAEVAEGRGKGTAKIATVYDYSWVGDLDDKAKRVIELFPADSATMAELNAMSVKDREARIASLVEEDSRIEKERKLKVLAKAKGKCVSKKQTARDTSVSTVLARGCATVLT